MQEQPDLSLLIESIEFQLTNGLKQLKILKKQVEKLTNQRSSNQRSSNQQVRNPRPGPSWEPEPLRNNDTRVALNAELSRARYERRNQGPHERLPLEEPRSERLPLERLLDGGQHIDVHMQQFDENIAPRSIQTLHQLHPSYEPLEDTFGLWDNFNNVDHDFQNDNIGFTFYTNPPDVNQTNINQININPIDVHEPKPDNGMSQQWIQTIPMIRFSEYCNANQDDTNQEKVHEACPMCLEEIQSDDFVRQLPCKHIFHPSCIDIWLQKRDTCPTCRFSFSNPQEIKETSLSQ